MPPVHNGSADRAAKPKSGGQPRLSSPESGRLIVAFATAFAATGALLIIVLAAPVVRRRERGGYPLGPTLVLGWLIAVLNRAHRGPRLRWLARPHERRRVVPAVPCHLDYTPRNLLAQPSGDIAVIDFEHARYDLAARDLVRLATRTWATRPDLATAFQRTYGALTGLDREIIDHCRHLDALTATVRAAGRYPAAPRLRT